ncbi:ABC transporter permease [Desulfobaculum bizertense]|uniref:Putative ABC transport system permease protein n=1 Tax=Desulfobaculum bizertense DSM 18034 TaxID=1121442 RepID=A0A1T4VFU9_9BACT|nr:ABC transporter permease [Desulfobaculum bizertense]UIJ37757.1 ABC transporter permease [Desulfobaculum bizertense]SKA63840.1 putative ABC transport system permease protein [Desulfobaculum bizertense DSM 18034]
MPPPTFTSPMAASPMSRLLHVRRAARFAAQAVRAYRLRSLFVISAIALGIAALTIIVTSIDGAERRTKEIMSMFGPDAAFVLGGDIKSRAVGQRNQTLSWSDVLRLRQSLPGAYLVVPMRGISNITARAGNKNFEVPTIVGATEGYAEVWNWPLAEGRDFTREDVMRGAKVALLGSAVAEELFGNETPLGRTIFLQNLPVRVVGLLTHRGFSGGGNNLDERVIIPLTTLTQRFNLDRKYFRALRIKFRDAQNMPQNAENLRSLLRHLHKLGPGDDDDFTILTADEIIKFVGMLKGGLVIFLGVTAAVAMIVGGFVLANLFYISVNERTAEIGLRKAVGAKSWELTLQFLFEAVILTCLGALLGMILGMALGQTLSSLGILTIEFSFKVFALSLLSAALIGLIFGIRPARSAARMAPVDALRGK